MLQGVGGMRRAEQVGVFAFELPEEEAIATGHINTGTQAEAPPCWR